MERHVQLVTIFGSTNPLWQQIPITKKPCSSCVSVDGLLGPETWLYIPTCHNSHFIQSLPAQTCVKASSDYKQPRNEQSGSRNDDARSRLFDHTAICTRGLVTIEIAAANYGTWYKIGELYATTSHAALVDSLPALSGRFTSRRPGGHNWTAVSFELKSRPFRHVNAWSPVMTLGRR